MIRDKLLEMLVCPENRTSLAHAEPALLSRLNQAIEAGKIKNRGGSTVEQTMDDGLVRQDGQFLYPVTNDIPHMLIDEAIPLDQLKPT